MDWIYCAIPRNNNEYKLLLLIGYNNIEKKTSLGTIILIKNENKEAFTVIFKYLISNHNFTLKAINKDC